MKFSSMRSAIVIASVIAGSVIPSQAFAQTPINVFSGGTSFGLEDTNYVTVYTFSSAMNLNSIGFLPRSLGPGVFEFAISTINNGAFVNADTSSLGTFSEVNSDGIRWFDLYSPITLSKDDTVTVKSSGFFMARFGQVLSPAANVKFETHQNGVLLPNGSVLSSSNLRVSNPGSNVAPEPGSIALLLTGGGALAGIALRRRRNAA
jgi:hypothetical protein